MKCIVCGSSNASDKCDFHSGYAFQYGTTDGRADYTDLYSWSCCAKTELAQIKPGKGEVPPDRSPGCTTQSEHLFIAKVLFVYSSDSEEFARTCSSAVEGHGAQTSLVDIADLEGMNFGEFDCLAMFPDHTQVDLVAQVYASVSTSPRPPWFLAFNVDPDSVNLRSQTTVADRPAVVEKAVLTGLCARHAQVRQSPFNVFLSYRRKDRQLASSFYNYLRCWWDQAVLGPGVEWSSEIEGGIRDCSLFLLLMDGDIPADSYVWKEVELALRYKKDIAVVAMEREHEALLTYLGIDASTLEEFDMFDSTLRNAERDRVRGSRAVKDDSSLLFFSGLHRQLGIPKDKTGASANWAGGVARLCSCLKGYPTYQFYSNREPVPVSDLLHPVEAGSRSPEKIAPYGLSPDAVRNIASQARATRAESHEVVDEGEPDHVAVRSPLFNLGLVLLGLGIVALLAGMPSGLVMGMIGLGGAAVMTFYRKQ